MIAHQEKGFTFKFRSGGVVVLKNQEYIGFFNTLDQALNKVFNDDNFKVSLNSDKRHQ